MSHAASAIEKGLRAKAIATLGAMAARSVPSAIWARTRKGSAVVSLHQSTSKPELLEAPGMLAHRIEGRVSKAGSDSSCGIRFADGFLQRS